MNMSKASASSITATAGPAERTDGGLIPHAADRLLRRARFAARHRLALQRQPLATIVPGLRCHGGDTRSFDADKSPAAFTFVD